MKMWLRFLVVFILAVIGGFVVSTFLPVFHGYMNIILGVLIGTLVGVLIVSDDTKV